MTIKNLAQLKKAIQMKQEFIIKNHRIEKFIGQKRKPNVIQTNGFYSILPETPNDNLNQVNGGKGMWIDYGKASQWEFVNGLCHMYYPEKKHTDENLIWSIMFCD